MKKLISTAGALVICLAFSIQAWGQVPNFDWAVSMGSTGSDDGKSIVADASGNVYSTGLFSSTVDFDPGPGTFNMTSAGIYDIYISKLDASGNFVWAKRIGGGLSDVSYGITLDASDNVYITGNFEGTVDFDPGPGTFNLSSTGSSDIFICKLDSDGNFLWAVKFGSTGGSETGYSVKVDNLGNVYATGVFTGTVDFDPGAGTFNMTAALQDAFILKLDAFANLIWAVQAANTQYYSLNFDMSGNIILTGYFNNNTNDFDPGAGIFSIPLMGSTDAIITKLTSGGSFLWAKSLAGTDFETCYSIAVDASSNVYVTGYFRSTVDFDPGPSTYFLTSFGVSDIFVAKLDASGNFVFAIQMGGTDTDVARSIALDAVGNIYVLGFFNGVCDFDPGAGTNNLTSIGLKDIFICKLDPLGNYIWAGQIGSTSNDDGLSLYLDDSDNMLITGDFSNTADFDPGPGTTTLNSAGGADIYISKYAPCLIAPSQPTAITGSSSVCDGSAQVYTIPSDAMATGYTWSLPSGWSGTSTDTTITVTAGSTGGDITVTADNSCGSSSAQTLTITVNPLPTVTASASPSTTICDGDNITLTGGGASSYSWTGGVTDGVAFTPALSGTYTVTGTDVNSCENTADISITVNPLPTVTATASPSATLCAGDNVTLTGGGASSYAWTGGVTDGVAFTPASSGTYTVTGTDVNSCENTADISITVNPLPTVTASASPSSTICDGDNITLTGGGAVSYTWTGGVTDGVAFTPSSTTTYTVTGTDGSSCQNTADITITVNPLPAVTFNYSGKDTICRQSGIQTLNGGSPSGGTYSGTGVTGSSFDPSVSGTGTFTITYSYTDGNSCTNTATQDITVTDCLGLDENQEGDLTIYPNPFNHEITIIGLNENATVILTSASGEVVGQWSLTPENMTINLDELSSGVYFIQLNTKSNSVVRRVVKK